MSAEVKGTLGYGRTRGAARLSAAEAHFGQHLFIIMWCLGQAPARRTESPGTMLAFTRYCEEEEAASAGRGAQGPPYGAGAIPPGRWSILSCHWFQPWGV